MIGHAERSMFTNRERLLYRDAARLVEAMPADTAYGEIRCHELARAVGAMLSLEVQDGYYGFVDHSWLWTRPLADCHILTSRVGFPNILDVYAVGRMPMVMLLDAEHTCLPHVGWAYRPDKLRDDIRWDVVERLIALMRKVS